MTYKIGLIRVLTTEDSVVLNSHGAQLEKYFPCFSVESRCIPEQYEGIHDEATKRLALPKILALSKEFADKDAIIVSCADDPGVEELRQLHTIPIVGAGTAVSILCAPQGKKVGILGITNTPPGPYLKNIGSAAINLGVPEQVNSTVDLMTEKGRAGCVKKAQELKQAGAQVIALACTGFSTIGLAPELEKLLGIPVLDPVLCEGVMTYFELIRKL